MQVNQKENILSITGFKANQYYKNKINEVFEKHNLSYKAKIKNNTLVIVSTWANSHFSLFVQKEIKYSFKYIRLIGA